MRDVFNADFNLLSECIKKLPNEDDLLANGPPTATQLRAEDQVIAAAAIMESETFERARAMLSRTFVQCLKLLGSIPCKYTLVILRQNTNCFLTPYMPWSCYLIIEKDTAAVKAYFRNAFALFSMKIVNLGETSLESLNIRSLDWLAAELEKKSGFSLCNHVVSMRTGSSAILDSMSSPAEMARAAAGSRMLERDKVYNICSEVKFLVGDYKLFKELPIIRQTVLQRQQADVEYTESVLSQFQQLVTSIDPLVNINMTEGDSSDYLHKVLKLPEILLRIMLDMEKLLMTDDIKSRVEEITAIDYHPPSTNISIVTEIASNKLSSRFANDAEDMETPRFRHRWNQGKATPSISILSKSPSHQTILQELKLRKIERQMAESSEPRPVASNSPRKERLTAAFSSLSSYADEQLSVDTNRRSIKNKKLLVNNRDVTKPKNASNRIRRAVTPIEKVVRVATPRAPSPTLSSPDTVEEPEPIELFDRMTNTVPHYTGRSKNLIDGDTAHNLTLLYYLVNAIRQSEQVKPYIVTAHELPTLESTTLNQAYLKVLQTSLPMIETLRDIVKCSGNLSTLRMMLYNNIGKTTIKYLST